MGFPAADDPAPTTTAELFERYYGLLVYLAGKQGIRSSRDAASEVLIRVIEKDLLGQYDPAQGNFKAFLMSYVTKTLLGLRFKQDQLWRREPLCGSARDLEHLLPPVQSHEDAVLGLAYVDHWYTRLRHGLDNPRAAATLDVVVHYGLELGVIDGSTLAYCLGSSLVTAHNWLWKIRSLIAAELGLPEPTKRPRRTRAQMAAARRAVPDPDEPTAGAA